MKKIAITFLSIAMFSCSQSNKETTPVIVESVQATPTVPEKITFPSLDGLPITANLYHKDSSAQVILLCHQARYNKFEYVGIAKSLWENGYNCLAIDQRSGGGLIEEFNETNIEAKKQNKPVEFLDAVQDIQAAINYAYNKYHKKIIIWGSSYSSALALYEALENDKVDAVISFSPGDYFLAEKGSLKEKLPTLSKPMFVTSSKEEAKELSDMLSKMKMNDKQTQFIPDSAGFHGSKALWRTSANNEEYWKAINTFLAKLK